MCDLEIDGFKNFVAMHYSFSQRDTPYWKYVADRIEYDYNSGLLDNLFLRFASEKHVILSVSGDPAHNDGLRYVGAGMGVNPINKHTMALSRLQHGISDEEYQNDLIDAELNFDNWNKYMYDWCNTLPSSYEFQKQTIYS